MSQNSLVLPTTGTLPGLNAIQDINAALDTLNTLASGASAPSSPEAGQFWHDTANKLIKIRSMDNTSWITVGTLDETAYSFTAAKAASATTAAGLSAVLAQASGGTGQTSVAALFTHSFGANGYRVSPDGFVEQWGTTPAFTGGVAGAVTFPMTFPNACLNITASLITNTTVSNAGATAFPGSTSTFSLVNQSSTSLQMYWKAFGY